MRPQAKAAAWIAATFVVGTAFGMVLNGALSKQSVAPAPIARPQGEQGPPMGFVDEMERLIQPHDDNQREQLRPFLERTDNANRTIVDGARIAMRAALDSLRANVAPLLDDQQRQRLADFGGPPEGRGAPGMRGGGPPGLDGGRGGRGRGGRGEPGFEGRGPGGRGQDAPPPPPPR